MRQIIQIFAGRSAHTFHRPPSHLRTGGIVEIEPEFSEILLSNKSMVEPPQLS
jgi:hypothetical protein